MPEFVDLASSPDISKAAVPRIQLFARGIELPAEVGVHAHEQGRTQILVFDIEATVLAPERDLLDESCDYAEFVPIVRRILAASHILLIETVARRVADSILALRGVEHVTVNVTKPGAVREARSVGVVVTAPQLSPDSAGFRAGGRPLAVAIGGGDDAAGEGE